METQEIVASSGNTLFDGAANLEKAMVKPPKAPPSHEEALQRARDNISATKQRAREWLDKSKAAEVERVATATAQTACRVAEIPEKRFLFLVQQTPYFSLQIMRVMAERLRRMNERR